MTLLQRRAHNLLALSHRPSTTANYTAQFKVFLSLAVFLDINDLQDINYIQCFMTFLYDNGLTAKTIATYVSAIKFSFLYYGLDHNVVQHPSITLLLRSFTINAPLKIRKQGIIDIHLLKKIIIACGVLPFSSMYRALFLLAFFSFCRISNFAPVSAGKFDGMFQFIRNDIVWGEPGAHLIVKWAKNMQDRTSHQVIRIPLLSNKLLCPILALQTYFARYPALSKDPMFINPANSAPLIQSVIRSALDKVLEKLSIPKGYITFHSFRRSGATYAFNHHIPLENIQAHGGWRSQAVWAYLKQAGAAGNRIALGFQHNIH